MVVIRPQARVLLSASNGVEYACALVKALRDNQGAVVDFETVDAVTPSFVNAFVMTLLDGVPREVLRARLETRNLKPQVVAAINRSIERYDEGVRLSSQLAVA